MDIFQHVAEELKKACLERFNSHWSDEDARMFALIAISAVKYWEGCNLNETDYKIVRIFGHSGNEIKKILEQHYKGKSQMTREEAKIILDGPGGRAETTIKLLEALGLIKFDEPKINKDLFRHGITLDNIKSLEHAGYKIIKQNSNVSVELTQHHAPHVPFRFRGKLKDIKQED